MASDAHSTEKSHGSPYGPREYIQITVFLAVITAIEFWLSYSGLGTALLATLLIFLSAVKFVMVVAFFMHLRFESRIFTQMFSFGFVLGAAILIALIAVFWNDSTDALGGEELPPLEHHHDDESRHYFLEGMRDL